MAKSGKIIKLLHSFQHFPHLTLNLFIYTGSRKSDGGTFSLFFYINIFESGCRAVCILYIYF